MNSGRDPLSFHSSDPRTVWVFALDVPSKQAAEAFMPRTPMMTADGKGRMDWPVRDSLGVHPLDPNGLELTDLKKLREYGFARYLADANGMPEDKVMPDAAMLDALEGFALLVFSSALTGSDAQLAPKAPLRHIATYRERDPAPDMAPLPSEAAKGAPLPNKKPSDAAMSGRFAMLALLVLFALTGLMIWVAG